ncbi:hypothetical protein AVEN_200238-1 [Araneus ventricosus]|uniref:Uncharacterized protein n=1 Tax=Araneus ventricosus TaxID=182803 RepID=A0A4Y2DTY9_ARAVE|nr:hypothetical protein AVEN_200238-1 [Araneus ventricosus]
MNVMFTVLYLTIGFNSLALSSRSCPQEPRAYTIDEMEKIVYAVAQEKGVPPSVILNRIMRKVKYRQRTQKVKPKNPLQDLALQELLGTNYRPPPPGSDGESGLLPPHGQSSSRSFQPSPRYPPLRPPAHPMPPSSGHGGLMTGVFMSGFAPQIPPQQQQQYPQSFYIPVQNLQPPPGVTIRVETGIRDGILPDVIVTLSPMMTIVEALKQAESKYRSYLGLSPASEEEVISFSRSSVAECYVIGSFNSVSSDDRGYWKIIVSDKGGKIIYDSICLPSRNEVAVRPGMTITLLYTLT